MNEENNLKEELFCIEIERVEKYKRKKSKKLIKSAGENITKIFLNHLDGKIGEC